MERTRGADPEVRVTEPEEIPAPGPENGVKGLDRVVDLTAAVALDRGLEVREDPEDPTHAAADLLVAQNLEAVAAALVPEARMGLLDSVVFELVISVASAQLVKFS